MDAPLARAARSSGVEDFLRSHKALRETIKAPGFFPYTLVLVVLPICFLHPQRRRAGLFAFLATLTAASNQLFKWIAGRTRPFKPPDGSGALAPFAFNPFPSDGKNLCFPSGHACLAFATAAALAMLWPRSRWRFVWYGLACVVAAERVAENAHWFSDTVAAAALGIGGAKLVGWLLWDRIKSWKSNDLTCRS